MALFFGADPGLNRRFAKRLELSPYSAYELAQICEKRAKAKRLTFETGLLDLLAAHIAVNLRQDMADQNGGLSINLTDAAQIKMASREVALQREGKGKVGASILTTADFGIDASVLALGAPMADVHHVTVVAAPAAVKVRSGVGPDVAESTGPDLNGAGKSPEMEYDYEEEPTFTHTTVMAEEVEGEVVRRRRRRVAEAESEESEEDEEDDHDRITDTVELTEVETMELLNKVGKCSMGFDWDPFQGNHPCDVCGSNCVGYVRQTFSNSFAEATHRCPSRRSTLN